MAGNKTVANKASVRDFLASVKNTDRRKDCEAVMKMMRRISGKRATMWGSSIVGFGSYHYRYESGREGDMPMTGVSPRAQNLTIYLMPGCEIYSALLKKLGPHTTGKSCLYVKRLSDVDADVLYAVIERAWRDMSRKYS